MRSIDFKRKPSVFRVIKEKPAKPKRNTDRLVYFVFLIGIGLFAIYYVTTKMLFIKAKGQVILQNVTVKVTDDSRIMKMYRKEGDLVKKGDSLFSYISDKDLLSAGVFTGEHQNMTISEKINWILKEQLATRKKIEENKIDLQAMQGQLSILQGKHDMMRSEVMLDVLPVGKLESSEREVGLLSTEQKKLQAENKLLLAYLEKLSGLIPPADSSYSSGSLNGNGDNTGRHLFLSPIDGTITRILFQESEVALKTDNIMSINKEENVYIKAFFDQKDVTKLQEGDIMRLKFPDGTISKGRLKRFYFATYSLPDEFQKRYDSPQRSVAADIYPTDSTELSHWQRYYKLEVDVSKFKY